MKPMDEDQQGVDLRAVTDGELPPWEGTDTLDRTAQRRTEALIQEYYSLLRRPGGAPEDAEKILSDLEAKWQAEREHGTNHPTE